MTHPSQRMLRGVSPMVHDELVKVLGILTDAIQELGWYALSLLLIHRLERRLGIRPMGQPPS